MSIDVFGHGLENPLPPSGAYSHGADRLTGPHRCRGGTKPCTGNTSDHMCCCDVCRHIDFFTCEVGCCKCLPVAICAVFTPTTPSEICKTRSYKMVPVRPSGLATSVDYSTVIGGTVLTLTAGEPQLGSPLHGQAACTWRVQYGETDEEVEITHLDGEVNCLRLPEFSIPATMTIKEVTCEGTITFDQFTYDKVPYLNRWHGASIETPLTTSCGTCTDACTVLAIRRGDSSDYGYSETTDCEEFIWDETEQTWIRDGERIEFVEVEGVCYLRLTIWNTATLEGDLIAVDHCTLGMVRTLQDELGNWVQISCNPCYCWQHICGTCRCLCGTLCVVGFVDGELTGPFELAWNSELLQWGDGYESPIVVLEESDSGGCQVSTEGFSDPVEIDPTCGNNIAFTFANSLEDQLENGINQLSGWCKQCVGSCANGSCLSECSEVPNQLWALVTPRDWTAMLGCEGVPPTDCFEPFNIPMVMMFVPTVLNPAGEWRWIGRTQFNCRNCGGDVSNNLAIMDIGCDGAGTLTVIGKDDSNQVQSTVVDIDFTLPCGADADWSSLGPWGQEREGSLQCCNEAGWEVTLTDVAP